MEEPNIIKSIPHQIGFIGGGNMAKAICEGIVSRGLVSYQQINVSGPRLNNLTWWSQRGCHVSQDNGTTVKNSGVIFISVKPHFLHTAIEEVKQTQADLDRTASKLFISILAGVTLHQLETVLKDFKTSRIIRAAPNTPMTVGEGCTIFCPHKTASKDDIVLVNQILSVTGVCRELPESLINVAAALAASGPAFIYMTIQSLADGAVKMGLPRAVANELAAQMTLGSAKMLRDSGKHAGTLKDEVCSPGGTTIEGVYALEKGGIRAAFMDAIESSTKKAAELAGNK